MFRHIIYEFICYTNLYAIRIRITDEFIERICFPVCVHVGTVERNMQEIKEEFNKVVLSICGSNIGKDNEVCFPSYKNKKKMQVEKQYKGNAG